MNPKQTKDKNPKNKVDLVALSQADQKAEKPANSKVTSQPSTAENTKPSPPNEKPKSSSKNEKDINGTSKEKEVKSPGNKLEQKDSKAVALKTKEEVPPKENNEKEKQVISDKLKEESKEMAKKNKNQKNMKSASQSSQNEEIELKSPQVDVQAVKVEPGKKQINEKTQPKGKELSVQEAKSPTKIEKAKDLKNKEGTNLKPSEEVQKPKQELAAQKNTEVKQSTGPQKISAKENTENLKSPNGKGNQINGKIQESLAPQKKEENVAGRLNKNPSMSEKRMNTDQSTNLLSKIEQSNKIDETQNRNNKSNFKNTKEDAKGQNTIEKQRVRSFDAGKTDKINANDSFETRTKIWEIRKKERLLEEEKKRLRKETEECTFSPQLNQASLARQLSPGDIYERNVEWTSKVKEALVTKGNQMLEEARKPTMKKHRVKSAAEVVPFESRKRTKVQDNDIHSRNGALRASTALNQSPLGIKGNTNDQVSEINEMFDVIASALKNKPQKQAAPKQIENRNIKTPNLEVGENRRESGGPAQQQKPTLQKVSQEKPKQELDRIQSLKGILNLKPGEPKKQTRPKDLKEAAPAEIRVSQSKDVRGFLKTNTQHLEIKNNRYVMIDNNFSPIEKKDDDSLNLEGSEIL